MRAAIIVAAALASMTPASAETLTCSDWQGIRTCQDGHGYISRETQWQGFTIGSNSEGARWTTNRWQGIDTTTVRPHQNCKCSFDRGAIIPDENNGRRRSGADRTGLKLHLQFLL